MLLLSTGNTLSPHNYDPCIKKKKTFSKFLTPAKDKSTLSDECKLNICCHAVSPPRTSEHHCLSALSLSVSLYACLKQPNVQMNFLSSIFCKKQERFIWGDTGTADPLLSLNLIESVRLLIWTISLVEIEPTHPPHVQIRTKRLHEWQNLLLWFCCACLWVPSLHYAITVTYQHRLSTLRRVRVNQ